MTQKHTPGPWFFNMIPEEHVPVNICFKHANGKIYTVVEPLSGNGGWEEQQANAAFIVKACNNYYNLLEQLEKELAWMQHIKPYITAPGAVMSGFDQAIKNIGKTIAKANIG